MEKLVEYAAVGRRKEAVARVILRPGSGKIRVNKRDFENFFTRETHRILIKKPLDAVKSVNKYDVYANITGGGISGQAGAFRHGIARALLKVDDKFRLVLKKAGFLTRDSRIKERKKYGQKRARKRFQFSKR